MKLVTTCCLTALAALSAMAGTWPTFHGNYALTGYSDTTLPTPPTRLWRVALGDPIMHTPVSDGSRIFTATDAGTVFAHSLQGQELWTRAFTIPNESDSSKQTALDLAAPLVVADQLLVAVTDDGHVFALTPETGETVWEADVDNAVQGTPTVVDGADGKRLLVVITQPNGALTAFDLTGGAKQWSNEGVARADGHLAASNGKLLYGSCAAAFHLFNGADGELEKEVALGEGCEMAGGLALFANRAFGGNRSGSVAAADFSSASTLWINEDGGSEMFTTPAVTEQWVVFATDEGLIQAVHASSGKTKWRFEAEGAIPLSPAIAGDKVVAAMDGRLYLLELATGKQRWSFEVSDEITGPAIVGGMIVVGAVDGSLWAFGAAK